MGGQLSLLLLHSGNKVQEHYAHLVAGHEHILALLVHGYAHPVAVGVCGQEQVRLYLFAEFKALLQRFPDFRVRVRAGGEVSVRVLLLGNHRHVLHAYPVKYALNAHQSAAVEGSIDQLQI